MSTSAILVGIAAVVLILAIACLLRAGDLLRRVIDILALVRVLEREVAAGAATGLRIEANAEALAVDVAEQHERADRAEGPVGAAGDAAARSA